MNRLKWSTTLHHGERRKWRASSGKFPSLKICIDGIIQVDVKHIGAQEVEASTSAAGQVLGALGDDDVCKNKSLLAESFDTVTCRT